MEIIYIHIYLGRVLLTYLGMVAHTYNPSTHKAEVWGLFDTSPTHLRLALTCIVKACIWQKKIVYKIYKSQIVTDGSNYHFLSIFWLLVHYEFVWRPTKVS